MAKPKAYDVHLRLRDDVREAVEFSAKANVRSMTEVISIMLEWCLFCAGPSFDTMVREVAARRDGEEFTHGQK